MPIKWTADGKKTYVSKMPLKNKKVTDAINGATTLEELKTVLKEVL